MVAKDLGQLLTSLVEVNLLLVDSQEIDALEHLMSFWPEGGGVECPIQKLRLKDQFEYINYLSFSEDMRMAYPHYQMVSTQAAKALFVAQSNLPLDHNGSQGCVETLVHL